MKSSICHLPADADAVEIIACLERDGCVVLDEVLTPAQHHKVKADLDSHLEKIPDCQGDFYGYATKRTGLLFSKSEVFCDMAIKPNILAVMDKFLLTGCSDYQINLTQAISIGEKEPRQIMHQDDPMFPFLHPGQEAMINCMWAIDDFTAENGSTVLVPGSHKWPREQALNLSVNDLPDDQIVLGEMKRGSVLIYLGSLFHCGGHNRTKNRRCGAVVSYSLGWLRQAENAYIGYSKEELLAMPERLQKLLGFFVHKPNLGSVDGIDPWDFLIGHDKKSTFTEFLPDEAKPIVRAFREAKLTQAA